MKVAACALLVALPANAGTFSDSSPTLSVDLVAGESVSITPGTTTYTFTLASTTWSGTDTANITGNGTTSLTVTAAGLAAFSQIIITDSGAGAAVTFDTGAGTFGAGNAFAINLDDANASLTIKKPVPAISGTVTNISVLNGGAIQSGVSAAGTGATISVGPGTFTENVTVSKVVTLKGAQYGVDARGRVSGAPNPTVETVVVPATASANTFNIAVNGTVVVDGFAFTGGTSLGVVQTSVGPNHNMQIAHNYFSGYSQSALFMNRGGTNITVAFNEMDGSNISGTGQAIFCNGPQIYHGLLVNANNVINNKGRYGLFVDGNHNVGESATRTPTISSNLFDNNLQGLNLGSRSFGTNGTPVLGTYAGMINDNVFSNNAFDGFQGGIQHVLVTRNTFSNNGRSGIALTSFGNIGADRGAQFSVITQNTFSGNAGEDLFFSATQAVGTIGSNLAYENSFGSVTPVAYVGTELINCSANAWGTATTVGVAGPIGSEIEALAVSGATGTFTLTLNSETTDPLPYNATAVQIQGALEALPSVNPGDVLVTSGNTIYIHFLGAYVHTDIASFSALGSGGATATLSEYRKGVAVPTVDYTPWLDSSSDSDLMTGGFQGDFSYLHVDDASPQSGGGPKIAEALGLLDDGALTGSDRIVGVDGGIYAEAVNLNVQVTLQIEGGVTINSLTGQSDTFVNLNGNTLATGDSTDTSYPGVISGASGTLTKQGSGKFTLTGDNTATGSTVVSAGTLLIDGSTVAGNAFTVNGTGVLGGTGDINGTINAQSGGTVAPGDSHGLLNSGSVTFTNGAVFSAQINATNTAGVDYDQLNVTGTVNLGGATLSLSGSISEAPSGSLLILINNDGTDPVVGTFAGLPEGSPVVFNSILFFITYHLGPNGNDVALLVDSPPTDITLDHNRVLEQQPIGTVVGNLTTTDVDIPNGDSHTYSLVSGVQCNDNEYFQISGSQLQTKSNLLFSAKSTYLVRIRTTDRFGLYYEEEFVIYLRPLPGTPPTATFANDFSSNLNGWTRFPGFELTSDGAGHGKVAPGSPAAPTAAVTDWGGYDTASVAGSGFTTSLDFYLDTNTAEGLKFGYTVVLNNPAHAAEVEFAYLLMRTNDAGVCGFLINTDTGAPGAFENIDGSADVPGLSGAILVTNSGWYSFQHWFHTKTNAGIGYLTTEMSILSGTNVVATWVIDTTEIVGTNVLGNRYGKIFGNEFNSLLVDNSSLTVMPRPVALATGVEVDEDTSVDVQLSGYVYPASSVVQRRITTGPLHGTLSKSTGVFFQDEIITYTPAADYFGTDSFKFVVSNGAQDSLAVMVSISVHSVNDAPSFALSVSSVTVAEDSALTTLTIVNSASVSKGPANESGQSISYLIDAGYNTALFTNQPAVSGIGSLSFRPAANASGNTTIYVRAMDNGGTACGGHDTSAAQPFLISITPSNDAPVLAVLTNVTVSEGLTSTPTVDMPLTITDVETPLASMSVSVVLSNQTGGIVLPGTPGTNYTGGQWHVLLPVVAEQSGQVNVHVTVTDTGDGPSPARSASRMFLLKVAAVNDAPGFVIPASVHSAPNVAVTTPGFSTFYANGATPSDTSENAQTGTYTVTVQTADRAKFATLPTITAAGTLAYKFAVGASGSCVVQVKVTDNGGTAGGGVNVSPTQNLTFIVDP